MKSQKLGSVFEWRLPRGEEYGQDEQSDHDIENSKIQRLVFGFFLNFAVGPSSTFRAKPPFQGESIPTRRTGFRHTHGLFNFLVCEGVTSEESGVITKSPSPTFFYSNKQTVKRLRVFLLTPHALRLPNF